MEYVFRMMIIYLFIVNTAGFILMGLDKRRAKRREWRIPEKKLFACALIGGSLGTTLGMYVFHHKTRHWYFRYGMPAIAIVQAVLINYIING